jgi:streptomycin 6-kinase
MSLKISTALAANCSKTAERQSWLSQLPEFVAELQQRWSLTIGHPFDGDHVSCAWVAAVRVAGNRSAVLKIGMPHFENLHEIEGLLFWNGDPTVRLLDSDSYLGALLLERCEPGTLLRTLPEPDQDSVIAGLLQRLWRPPHPPHPFRPLSALLERWSKETLTLAERWPDPGLVRAGLDLWKELLASTESAVLLATDLHAANVLRAQRETWSVIDPKPFVGDPAYDATQHLLNCDERLQSDFDATTARFADLAGLDPERVRLWTFSRLAAEPRDRWQGDDWFELARAIAARM